MKKNLLPEFLWKLQKPGTLLNSDSICYISLNAMWIIFLYIFSVFCIYYLLFSVHKKEVDRYTDV